MTRAARKDFVVRRPVFLGVALEADGAGQRALAHAAQDAKSQGQGSFQAALLGEDKSPEPGLFEKVIQQVHKAHRASRKRGCSGRTHTVLEGVCRVCWRSWR